MLFLALSQFYKIFLKNLKLAEDVQLLMSEEINLNTNLIAEEKYYQLCK